MFYPTSEAIAGCSHGSRKERWGEFIQNMDTNNQTILKNNNSYAKQDEYFVELTLLLTILVFNL